MPVDHKRINAPNNTVPYRLYIPQKEPEISQILDKKNLRKDKRKDSEHRKIFVKTGVSSQAKGSAYIEQGNTKVMVSVYDPREKPNPSDYSSKGTIYCEFKYAPFSCFNRRLHQQDDEEKQYSNILKQALESSICLYEFPNFQVDIYAVVLENDGSALSAAITCSGIALAHAGIPMYDLVTSVTMSIQADIFLLDPTYLEEELCNLALGSDKDVKTGSNQHGIIVLSMLSTHQQVSQFCQTGNVTIETLAALINKLTEANKEIVPLVEKILIKHILKNKKDLTV